MANSPAQWSQQMLATLAVTLPSMGFPIGSPERKIIDALGEALSASSVNQYVSGSLLDIDSKSGMELEQYVGTFGFGRLQGSPATGEVTVTMNAAQPQPVTVAQGVQCYTSSGLTGSNSQLFYSCTQSVVLPPGQTTIVIDVRCNVVGSQGNVAPDTIVFISSVLGAASCTNLQSLTGGVDVETDAELRQRFKDTFLRNVAGTADWFTGIALQNTSVNSAKVFGPVSLYQTQITAPSQVSGSNTLNLQVNQDVKYVWPDMNSCFTNIGQDDEVFYSPNDDFVLSSGVSPVFTNVTTGQIPAGTIVDLEFQYTTRCSRNDPANGITDKIDLFVGGSDPYTVNEQTVVVAQTLTNTNPASPYYTGNFIRVNDTGAPTNGNRFMRLGSNPIVPGGFPSTITVGSTVYTQGTHYHLLQANPNAGNQQTLKAGSQFETAGIEWESSGASTGTELTLQYVYNRVPETLSAIIDTSKQIGTDVMVHAAPIVYVQPCVNIEYDRSYSISVVNNAIAARMQSYFQALGFGPQVHLSNMLLAIQQVNGVVSVSLTPQGTLIGQSTSHYGVQLYTNSADVNPASSQTTDFKLNDNTIPQFLQVIPTRVATP